MLALVFLQDEHTYGILRCPLCLLCNISCKRAESHAACCCCSQSFTHVAKASHMCAQACTTLSMAQQCTNNASCNGSVLVGTVRVRAQVACNQVKVNSDSSHRYTQTTAHNSCRSLSIHSAKLHAMTPMNFLRQTAEAGRGLHALRHVQTVTHGYTDHQQYYQSLDQLQHELVYAVIV